MPLLIKTNRADVTAGFSQEQFRAFLVGLKCDLKHRIDDYKKVIN